MGVVHQGVLVDDQEHSTAEAEMKQNGIEAAIATRKKL